MYLNINYLFSNDGQSKNIFYNELCYLTFNII